MRRAVLPIAIGLLALAIAPAGAVEPGEILKDPALEARARAIGAELRCVVCQNQSIDDSNADLARDLRRVVRERLVAGDSNERVIAYVASRYGDFVLLRPPLKPETALLWGGPGLVLLSGVVGVAVYFRRRRTEAAGPVALSADEERRLRALLDGERER
jgi:cytochrome c-type biogenesis protein CcmH